MAGVARITGKSDPKAAFSSGRYPACRMAVMRHITELDAHRQGVELDTLAVPDAVCASLPCHILASSLRRNRVAAATTAFPFSS